MDEQPPKRPVAAAISHTQGQLPQIIASGKGIVAQQIVELAFAHGIKVREDADLAELLAAMEIDSPIPVEAYMAVAEILAYLYKANQR